MHVAGGPPRSERSSVLKEAKEHIIHSTTSATTTHALPSDMSVSSEAPPRKRKITPTTKPISLLPTSAAQTYTHIHPVVLLTVYYIRFPALVADPISTLTTSVIPLCILQLSYVIACLPPAAGSTGSRPTTPTKTAKSKPGPRRKTPTAGSKGASSELVPWGKMVVCLSPDILRTRI